MNKKILTLLGTLALGTAMAAPQQLTIPAHTALTTPGTKIKNVATANFDDPANSGTTKKVTSNEVVTEVKAKAKFDIVYNGTEADGGTDASANTIKNPPRKGTAIPGQVVHSEYWLENYGNASIKVDITADKTGATAGKQTVKYEYFDGTDWQDVTGALDVQPGHRIKIRQTITVDSSATSTDVIGASPIGIADGNKNPEAATGVPSAGLQEDQESGVAAKDDKQFTRYTVSVISNVPNTTPDNDDNEDTNPDGKITPPPTLGDNPKDEGSPTDPTDPTDDPNKPSQPSKPGYSDPTPAPSPDGKKRPTNIVIKGNEQIAYPPADKDKPAKDDKVTFINTVTNGGSSPVTVKIPKEIDVLDPSGNTTNKKAQVIVPGAKDDGKGNWVVDVPGNGSVDYTVTVPYEDDANLTPGVKRKPVHVNIPVQAVDSTGSPIGNAVETKDTVVPPNMTFGDDDGSSSLVNDPAPQPTETVSSRTPATSLVPVISGSKTSGAVGSTVFYKMNIGNTGAYPDRYVLDSFVDQDPTEKGSKVANGDIVYVDASGKELPKDLNGKYVTTVVQPGSDLEVYAVVETGKLGFGTYYLDQTATAQYSGIQLKDTNDKIVVQVKGAVDIVKTQKGAGNSGLSALSTEQQTLVNAHKGYGVDQDKKEPGKKIEYGIFAKNSYNTDVKKFSVCDTFDPNLENIILTSPTTNVIYSAGTGGYAPYGTNSVITPGKKYCFALDADGNNIPDDLTTANPTFDLFFEAKIK